MTTQLWTGFTRLYLNPQEERPAIWSVDRGAGTPQLTAQTVALKDAHVVSAVDANGSPEAWLEGTVAVGRNDDGGLLICHIYTV